METRVKKGKTIRSEATK